MKKFLGVALVATSLMTAVAINYAVADVTVYGRAHLSVDSLDNGTDSSLYLSNNASRLGFKGSQELGMGLTGEFQYEVSYDPTGGGVGGARTNFLCLSGDFGKLLFGRLDSALKGQMDRYQMFGDQIGDAGNFLGRSGAVSRLSNALAYQMPTTGNIGASVAFVPEEGQKDTGGLILGGEFNNEDNTLFVGLGYANLKKGNTAGGTNDQKTTQLLANYKVSDVCRLMAVYQNNSNLGYTSTAKLKVIGAGVAYKASDETTLKAQYYKANDTASNAKNGATVLALGADYALSKTTTVYVAYAKADNKENGVYTPLNWGHGNSPAFGVGKDPSGISVGAVHKF